MAKKQSLFPVEYDEVSLVDSGASQEAHVLIYKRDGSITKAIPPGSNTLNTLENRSPSGTAKKKPKTRSQSNPCATGTNSTGAKKGKKGSQRAKNWKEGRHPRDEKGRMAKTDSKSKSKFGKGGTTKAKLDAACKKKSVKKVFAVTNWDNETVALEKMERKATR